MATPSNLEKPEKWSSQQRAQFLEVWWDISSTTYSKFHRQAQGSRRNSR